MYCTCTVVHAGTISRAAGEDLARCMLQPRGSACVAVAATFRVYTPLVTVRSMKRAEVLLVLAAALMREQQQARAQHLLTNLAVTPCLNDTLVPVFSTDHYLYTAMEADPLTASVAITATPSDPSSKVSVLVDGRVVPASQVPLHNATDGPGPDKGTLIDVQKTTMASKIASTKWRRFL
eukprot:COSAG02_NODE_2341_length_9104_cov_2.666185_11_plen_178_part_01